MTGNSSTPVYSIVIPTFNGGRQLIELVDRLQSVFENELQSTYEIILIDDGSSNPSTRETLANLSTRPNVLAIFLTKNFGKPGAVMCGLSRSRGQWVITIDDDLQQRPEDIPKLIALRNHALVTATHKAKQHTWLQRLTSKIKQKFDRNLLGYSTPLSPLKLIQHHVVEGMLQIETNRPFIPALIRQVTNDVVAVETDHHKSVYGRSRYTFARRWSQFSNLLIGNSAFMMRVFAWIGFTFAAASFLLAAAILMRKLFGHPVQAGWSSLMVTILLIGGLNLSAVGISGQYFIRILDISSRKPAYIIRETLGEASNDE